MPPPASSLHLRFQQFDPLPLPPNNHFILRYCLETFLVALALAFPNTVTILFQLRIRALAGLTDYSNAFALLIDNLLTSEECSALISAAEANAPNNAWATALVNVAGGLQQLRPEVRLCDSILWDEPAVAAQLLARITPHLPAEIATLANTPIITGWGPVRRKEVWALTRLNQRLRFLRYLPEMYFAKVKMVFKSAPDMSVYLAFGTRFNVLITTLLLN
ncbi:hypothetical protein DV736_g3046, partial [Chaetothyriales sp. CBS 134916]